MKPLVLLALLLSATLPAAAGATTISLSYAGSDLDDAFVTSTGTGSISFNGDGQIGLGGVTGFSFDLTITSSDPSDRFSDTFSYRLSDLVSFGATAAGGTLTALAFRTGYESLPDGFLAPEYVVQSALRAGGLVTYFGPGDDAQHGTLRVAAAVPEPPGWWLAPLPLTLLGLRYRWGAARPA